MDGGAERKKSHSLIVKHRPTVNRGPIPSVILVLFTEEIREHAQTPARAPE
jgi:hypothetical protein